MITSYVWKVSVLAASLCGISPFLLYSQQYVAEGSVVFRSRGLASQAGPAIKRDFVVAVDGCRWLITTTNRSAGEAANTSWATGCTNGTEIYCATYYTNGYIMAVVESNTVPSACDDGVSQYLWLMLASGCYLDEMKDNLLPPVFDPLLSVVLDKNLKIPAHVDRMAAQPHLPLRIA